MMGQQVRGKVEGIRRREITGWLWDPGAPDEHVPFELTVNGTAVGRFSANRSRGDLKRKGIGKGDHLFRIAVGPGWLRSGTNVIEVALVSPRVGTFRGEFEHAIAEPLKVLPPSSAETTQRTSSPSKPVPKGGGAQGPVTLTVNPSNIEGRIDRVNDRMISGWAFDKSRPDEFLIVEILDGDRLVDTCVACELRADLRQAGKGDGCHAFRVSLPDALKDGLEHRVFARVKGTKHLLNKIAVLYKASPERPYQNWQEYLVWALHHREFSLPGKENDMRILGHMAWQRTTLHERYARDAQDVKASIIMPAYNRASTIAASIESVLAQTYRNWELLVVDDGSSDETMDIVSSFEDERIKGMRSAENRGVSHARNRGLEAASGDIVAYLDSDNTWDSHFLMIMANAVRESQVNSAYCAQRVLESVATKEGEKVVESELIRFGPFNRALLENRNYIDLNAFVHTKALVERLGGFREDMRRLVDWEFILRCTTLEFPLAVPCILSNYYHGKATNQITRLEPSEDAEACIRRTLASENSYHLPLEQSAYVSPPAYEFFVRRPVLSPARRRGVTIVLVSYEAGEYLDYCIQSVFAFSTDVDFRLIIVDNASTGSALEVLKKAERRDAVTVVRNTSNVGFTFAVNQGIALAREGDDILLLNNDAVVTEGWIEAMQHVVDLDHSVGLVVPRQTLLPGTKTMATHVPYCSTRREVDVNLSVHHANVLDPTYSRQHGWIELSFAPFFAVYITRECLDLAGPLDEENGRHYRSDRLYCDVVRHHARKRIIYTPHSKLYHFLQQSTSDLRNSDGAAFRRIFEQNTWAEGELEAARRAAYGRQAR